MQIDAGKMVGEWYKDKPWNVKCYIKNILVGKYVKGKWVDSGRNDLCEKVWKQTTK